jgi:hypothetical protein
MESSESEVTNLCSPDEYEICSPLPSEIRLDLFRLRLEYSASVMPASCERGDGTHNALQRDVSRGKIWFRKRTSAEQHSNTRTHAQTHTFTHRRSFTHSHTHTYIYTYIYIYIYIYHKREHIPLPRRLPGLVTLLFLREDEEERPREAFVSVILTRTAPPSASESLHGEQQKREIPVNKNKQNG